MLAFSSLPPLLHPPLRHGRRIALLRRPIRPRATLDTSSLPPHIPAPSCQSAPVPASLPSPPLPLVARVAHALETLRQFSRPHTVVGTLVAVVSMHILAWKTVWLGFPKASYLLLSALIPALSVNLFIVGLNQVYDLPIDTINKPYLPLPSGRLSLKHAHRILFLSLAIGLAFCFVPGANFALTSVLVGSALLGAAYSAPPFRLKRWPVLASVAILTVRGILVNTCFLWHALQAVTFTPLIAFSVSFFVLFGIVIALLKDVPDIRGDRIYGIRTFSVRVGPRKVFAACVSLLASAFVYAAYFFAFYASNSPLSRVAAMAQLMVAASLVWRARNVDPSDHSQAFDYYMFTWKTFYLQYFLLPLA